MIIDLILDRRDAGIEYSPKKFYTDIMGYYQSFPEIAGPIADALDNGNEEDVKRELVRYMKEQGYSDKVEDYIMQVKWL